MNPVKRNGSDGSEWMEVQQATASSSTRPTDDFSCPQVTIRILLIQLLYIQTEFNMFQ